MKTNLWICVTALALITAAAFAAPPPTPVDHVPNELLVKFRPEAAESLETELRSKTMPQKTVPPALRRAKPKYNVKDAKPLFRAFKQHRQEMRELRRKHKKLLSPRQRRIARRLARADKGRPVPDLSGIYRVRLDLRPGQSLKNALKSYQNDPNVEYAELNYVVSVNNTPDDPLYPVQWPLHNTGQDYPYSGRYNTPPGIPDADIDAPEAWDDGVGLSKVVVAVVDTGVDYNHRDLQANMWTNTAELTGADGVDDDNNGYVDDIYGYDFINVDGDPIDDAGHGTHCAGTIAAQGNNGLDIAGVCWNARIMALKFLSASGSGDIADALTAFYYAVDNGADVISNSWGGGGFSQATQDIINYARSQGIIVVASAGNDGLNYPQYPAYYDNMISVAATNSLDRRAPFSNYGSWVDIAAPGVDILSLLANGTYIGRPYDAYTTLLSGTSMSCPHISGASALLLSIDPQMSGDLLEQYLEESADPVDPNICASGRLNLFAAIRKVIGPDARLLLDRQAYPCQGTINIELRDSHLAESITQDVTIFTDGGDFEIVTLARRSPGLGVFNGSITLQTASPIIADGILQAAPEQLITVAYEDANDGTGMPGTVTDTAVVDCQPPIISDVHIGYPGREPQITFKTNEPATARIRCGKNRGGPYTLEAFDAVPAIEHSIILEGLEPGTRYYFIIDANDAAGNNSLNTNKGRCFRFKTNTPGTIFVPWNLPTIQRAIDNSWDGGVVCVADGIYTGSGNTDLDFKGRPITVRSLRGPEKCVIDCNGSPENPHRGFRFHSGEDANSVLKGFTVTNGHIPGSWYVGVGGAILCSEDSGPTIMDCRFINNSAGWDGGAICNLKGNLTLRDCAFIFNTAIGNDGGAINNETGTITAENCTFTGNSAFDWGGAIRTINSTTANVSNCVLSGNHSDDGGAIFIFHDSNAIVANCTFAGNVAQHGNALACDSWVPVNNILVTNCIFADGFPEIINSDGSVLDVTYTNIPGLRPGVGNIDVDPCFADPGYWDANDWVDGDYHLRSQAGRWHPQRRMWVKDSVISPCIDAGDPNAGWLAEPWPNGSRVNMGAYGNTPHASKSKLLPPPVETHLRFIPRILVPSSNAKWLRAWLLMPPGFSPENIDKDTSAVIEPLGVRSAKIKVIRIFGKRVLVRIYFDRRDVIAALRPGATELTVVGRLTDGRYFVGTDKVFLLGCKSPVLQTLASDWLKTGTNLDSDLDGDGTVNIRDFAILAADPAHENQ